jgi:hypothetical protein
MRIHAIGVLAIGTLLLGCGSSDKGNPVGGGGGGDDTGGNQDTGGSTATGGTGGSGPVVKHDAAPPSGGSSGGDGGSGGGDDTRLDASSNPTTVADAGATSDDGPPPTGEGTPPPSGLTKIFDGTTTNGWDMNPAGNCVVKDGTLASSGVGRGWCATKADYSHYRILFSLHPGGTGGHAPTVLIFNTRAPEGQKGLDALGGIQFQPPNGGHWDYRPGKNTAGAGFTKIGGAGPAVNGWYQCEIIANAATGEAKMACGGKDVLHYKQADAGKKGPWAIQTHNKGITDAYKDIQIEEGIANDNYTTVK